MAPVHRYGTCIHYFYKNMNWSQSSIVKVRLEYWFPFPFMPLLFLTFDFKTPSESKEFKFIYFLFFDSFYSLLSKFVTCEQIESQGFSEILTFLKICFLMPTKPTLLYFLYSHNLRK